MKSAPSRPPVGEPVVFRRLDDLPPLPVSLAPTLANKTGTWRYLRPFYEEKTSPCNHACPAGSDVVHWIGALRGGDLEGAWRTLTAENPLPGVCGRVCPHPCESRCNRSSSGGAIAIHALERYLADEASMHGWRPTRVRAANGRRVAVVGAGPAGLACAYHLARLGYEVTVHEAEAEPGGLLRYAIPAYRLPRDVLDREVCNIESLGVRFMLGSRLGDNLSLEELRGMDAVFLAPGQGVSRPLGVPGEQAAGVLSGLGFLRRVARGEGLGMGRRVVVVGGGNTAIDAARTAIRMGAQVTVVYRRSAAQMPAIAEEVEAARAEGVEFRFLAAPIEVLVDGDRVRGLRCQSMRLGEPDASGRERPLPVPGAEFDLTADTVIAAVGQGLDEGLLAGTGLRAEAGRVPIDEGAATALPGVFAGGDAATGEGTVAQAIGSGKRAALAIDRWLQTGRVEGLPPLGVAPHAMERSASARVVGPEDLNADYIEQVPRPVLPECPVELRKASFDEVNLGIPPEIAAAEAARCISCGVCIGCDTCYIFCPDVSIARAGPCQYTINYDYCKGCGICVHECPRCAMSVKEEGQ